MDIRSGESVLKVYHHHPTPFILKLLKLIVVFIPFFVLLFGFQEVFSTTAFVVTNIVLFVIFALTVLYFSLIFWLDKLVVTNQRVVFINWKLLTSRDEAEAQLDDIQDIRTKEKGVFSYFKFLDYGYFRLDTASSNVVIEFVDSPDPEGIRQFIYHVKKQ